MPDGAARLRRGPLRFNMSRKHPLGLSCQLELAQRRRMDGLMEGEGGGVGVRGGGGAGRGLRTRCRFGAGQPLEGSTYSELQGLMKESFKKEQT